MKKIRWAFAAFVLFALLPLAAQALLQSQRDQIAVTILINVTPNPLAKAAAPGLAPGVGIIAKATLQGAPPAIERAFEAQQLHFIPASASSGGGQMVAQVQKGVKVEASVAPNPLGTLLYSDTNTATVSAEAGVPTKITCVYHVTVSSTQTSWTLKHGLSNDFSGGSGGSFPGGDVANNSYVASPNPTSTPFLVYTTDGGVWAVLAASGLTKTYCVDLTVSMPITTPQGTYSSNAIYTLYY